jgi:probable rRNA maturation factor
LVQNLQEPPRRSPLPLRRIRRLVETLLTLEAERPSEASLEVSVVFCGDELIRTLNRQYRGQDKATDVLSFPQEDGPPGGGRMLGDVVISTDTARRQAREGRRSMDREVEWLLAHGLLHLLGYDDETEAGAREMEERGQAVITALYAT